MTAPLIIGHRGASAVTPENTMAAFREAIRVGADGIEFDVRLSRDGFPVVIHDNTLHRTGGLPHRVADLDWSELSKVDVGSWFARSFAEETVPSLRELFRLFEGNNLVLCLEMKCDTLAEQAPLATACGELINEFKFKERVIVECFKLPALRIVKDIDAEIKTAALFDKSLPSLLPDDRIIAEATAIGASYLTLNYRLARRGLLDKARHADLKVAVWTVDDPKWIEYGRETGIEALITNDPALMLA